MIIGNFIGTFSKYPTFDDCFCKEYPWFASVSGDFEPRGVELIDSDNNMWVERLGSSFALRDGGSNIPRLAWES